MKVMQHSTSELVEAIRKGGAYRNRAIRTIYDNQQLKRQVTRFVEQNSGNAQDGEDIFHEGIILLDRNVRQGKLKDVQTIEGYLFSVCRYLWMNQMRKSTKVNLTENVMDLDQIEKDRPDVKIFRKERKTLIDEVLSNLGDRCQQLLKMWKQSFSMDEIASRLGFSSREMAKKNKYRCYKRLVAMLDEKPEWLKQLKDCYER